MQFWTRTPFAFLRGTLLCVACGAIEPVSPTTWGSDQASLVIVGNRATMRVLASGGCYGSWGEIDQAIPSGAFTLSGTYTQLTGVSPGHVQYAAVYSGSIGGNVMELTIVIPTQQWTIGPFHLTAGVTRSWSPCLYP